eukprot:jgi/Tetstr1/439380/TSEL_027815.t1
MRELQSLAWRAQYMQVAIPAARFYLLELHDVVGSKWGGRVAIPAARSYLLELHDVVGSKWGGRVRMAH